LKGYEVVLIGGPGDKDKMDSTFQGLGDRVHNLAGQTSLKSLAAVFKRGDCLITNDSGPMHLAVAVGLPVIAFFGPSNPLRTGPYGWQNENGQNKVLCSRISCVPCYKRECSHKECLMNISVDQVLGALEELLKSDTIKKIKVNGY
jgi:ADP-heptose:LPS heptosyltransferase